MNAKGADLRPHVLTIGFPSSLNHHFPVEDAAVAERKGIAGGGGCAAARAAAGISG